MLWKRRLKFKIGKLKFQRHTKELETARLEARCSPVFEVLSG